MLTRQIFKPVSTTAAATMLLALSSPLYADPEASTSAPVYPAFQKLDVNHDGYVSRDEAAKLRDFGNAFNEADANHDGRLDPDEFVKTQAIYDRVRARAYIDDSVITAKVKVALVKDPEVKALEVSVETNRGVVLLSGFVDNEKQARRAQEIAASIQGVRNVRSNLLVKS